MYGPLVLSFLAFLVAVVVAFVMFIRYQRNLLRHQERMAAIEKGITLPPASGDQDESAPRVYLLRGMIWLFSGLALIAFVAGMSQASFFSDPVEAQLNRIRYAREAGATEQQLKQIEREAATRRRRLPEQAAGIGLVPVGVGAAYLIFYFLEGRRRNPQPAI